jgi:hypothetical protein
LIIHALTIILHRQVELVVLNILLDADFNGLGPGSDAVLGDIE